MTSHGDRGAKEQTKMELARVLRELWRRKWLVGLGAVIAVGAAAYSVHSTPLKYSAASTQVLVDSRSSVLGNISQSSEALSARAQLLANFMASPAILDIIGRQVGVSGGQIAAAGPVNAQEPRVEQEPTDLKRNLEITGETTPYRLNYEAQGNLPTITIYSQAPTTKMALGLANAAVVGLRRYVSGVESANAVPTGSRIVLKQLGPANGGVVDGGVSKTLAAIVFLAVFLVWCGLLLYAARFRMAWRASAVRRDGAVDGLGELADQDGEMARTAEGEPRDREDDGEGAAAYVPSRREDGRPTPVVPARIRW